MQKDIKNAKDVVLKEKNEVQRLLNRFGEKKYQKNFSAAIESIFKCKGKVVISGVGKSGIVAQKIVATFNSTGTHSVFLHSADSIHGDLGIIEADDVVVLISKSGESDETENLQLRYLLQGDLPPGGYQPAFVRPCFSAERFARSGRGQDAAAVAGVHRRRAGRPV